MTLITFQDGKPVMRDGKVGMEQECCCGGGGCCVGFGNCYVTYTVTLSDSSTVTGEGYLPITSDQNVLDAIGGLSFEIVPITADGKCLLAASWATEFFCDEITYDVIGYTNITRYKMACTSCCDNQTQHLAYGCTITEDSSEELLDPPCENGTALLGPHVNGITIDSIACDETECNSFP